jgi:hypothetical protein
VRSEHCIESAGHWTGGGSARDGSMGRVPRGSIRQAARQGAAVATHKILPVGSQTHFFVVAG